MQNQNQTPQPPPHKSEKMFRRYEQHIFTILNNWPDSTTFNPTPLRATTFSARLRDAISSVLEYQWTTPLDVERLRQLWDKDLEVTMVDTGHVVACKKGTRNALAIAGKVTAGLGINDFSVEVDAPARHILHALAILLSAKVLNKPVKITNANPEFLQEVIDKHDVGVSQEDGATILL